MKRIRKCIAFVVALMLLFSCSVIFVGAEEPLKFVVLGDSIAWGAGVTNSEEACYARIVANTNGYTYVNHAVSGSTTANLLQHLQNESIINDIRDADIINISIGGNDFLQQNLPVLIARVSMGNYKNIDDITEMLSENYTEAINTIKSINPDVVIIAQTLYNPRIDALREIYGIAVDRVNSCIYAYAEQNPGVIHIMDVRPLFEGRFDYIAIDTIHPSASGNVAIATLLLQTLYELNLGENTEPVIETVGMDELPFSSQILNFFRTIILRISAYITSLFTAVA